MLVKSHFLSTDGVLFVDLVTEIDFPTVSVSVAQCVSCSATLASVKHIVSYWQSATHAVPDMGSMSKKLSTNSLKVYAQSLLVCHHVRLENLLFT